MPVTLHLTMHPMSLFWCVPVKAAVRTFHIIEENGLGVCCDPVDVEDIARGFREMLNLTDEDKARIKASAEHLMNTRFCREAIVDRIESLSNGLIRH